MSRYDNAGIYADYEFDDETSSHDPKGVWVGGCEYYSRTYRCRVPRRLLEKAENAGHFDAVHDWIDSNQHKAIWRG